jgi:CRP/FNR family transcriptional regulator, cyclic AMP receptor protein
VTKAEITELLSRVPLFSGCSQREIAAIARAAKEVHRREGSVLARTGEPGVGFFLIVDGKANVVVNGRKRGTLGSGDFFGEISLLDGGPRSADVVAATDVDMLGLTAWVFRGVLEQYPSIAQKMLVTMAGRLRDATKPAPTD